MKRFSSATMLLTSALTLFSSLSIAQQRSFTQCRADQRRNPLDNYCPRLEGKHLDGCCPPVLGATPIQCQYVVIKSRGQPTLIDSSYVTCIDNKDVTVPCCAASASDCTTDPVTVPFTQRLIQRDSQCCFEPCPTANYWTTPPNPFPQITNEHVPYDAKISRCIQETINSCQYGSQANCLSNAPCPVQVDPGGGPGGDPGGGPGGGTGQPPGDPARHKADGQERTHWTR